MEKKYSQVPIFDVREVPEGYVLATDFISKEGQRPYKRLVWAANHGFIRSYSLKQINDKRRRIFVSAVDAEEYLKQNPARFHKRIGPEYQQGVQPPGQPIPIGYVPMSNFPNDKGNNIRVVLGKLCTDGYCKSFKVMSTPADRTGPVYIWKEHADLYISQLSEQAALKSSAISAAGRAATTPAAVVPDPPIGPSFREKIDTLLQQQAELAAGFKAFLAWCEVDLEKIKS